MNSGYDSLMKDVGLSCDRCLTYHVLSVVKPLRVTLVVLFMCVYLFIYGTCSTHDVNHVVLDESCDWLTVKDTPQGNISMLID